MSERCPQFNTERTNERTNERKQLVYFTAVEKTARARERAMMKKEKEKEKGDCNTTTSQEVDAGGQRIRGD